MKIVFWGSGEFALISLKVVVNHHQILSVITSADRREGRGLRIKSDIVKQFCLREGLKVYTPINFSPRFISILKEEGAELFVVVNYGRRLSREILEIPRIYSINLHPSLLPKYRGPAPINWVLINGEKKTGVSVIKINERIDAGEIIYQKEVEIGEEEDAGMLGRRLAEIGAEMLLKAIELIRRGEVRLKVQQESMATYFPKLKKSDGEINWRRPAKQIHNLIRGFTPQPGAFTFYKGKRIKVLKSAIEEGIKVSPSEIVKVQKKRGILVGTGEGGLWIEELQMEGRRRMKAGEFIAGYRIKEGERLCR